ncbi:MAG: IclR family transcriptional regulator [Propionibacteriaceae bacterium]|jgi:DNA-binding IclR family transcriptional regulator|nr:IclR family transcriptional regulator [Propionibacteriaceae bacterium]
MQPNANHSSSVERAFELIGIVAAAGPQGIQLSGLAKRAHLAVSTCHRYATTLLDLAVLDRDAAGNFRLGIGLVALAGRYLEEDSLRATAHPHLVELSQISGETVHLGTLAGDHIVYIDKIESDKSVRLVSRIGAQAPLHCTSMGKAILAALPETDRERSIADDNEIRTPHTLVGDALREELNLIRTCGWAIDDQENEEGVRCIGAAIISTSGTPVGALSISAPANRFSRQDCELLAPQVTAAARDIGRRIG